MNRFTPRATARLKPPEITLDVLIGVVAMFDLLAAIACILVISERI